jgi:hypothetical protein
VCTLFLETLDFAFLVEELPEELVELIHDMQEALLEKWTELNEDD